MRGCCYVEQSRTGLVCEKQVHIFLLRAAGDQQEFDGKLSGEELANILLVAAARRRKRLMFLTQAP
jgi:hypothetical protein